MVPDSTRWTGPWLGITRSSSLQRVANRPIICHVLNALAEAGVVEVGIAAPADVAAEVRCSLEAEGPRHLAVHHLDRGGGEEEALLAAAEFVGDAPCVLHRADGLLGEPIPAIDAAGGQRPCDAVLLVSGAPAAKVLRLISPSQHACGDTPLGVAGVLVLGPGALSRASRLGRSQQPLDFAAITEDLARDGAATRVQLARRWRHFSGDALELLDMNRAILDTLVSEATASPEDGNRFEGKIEIHPTARISSTVIVGPVMIGPEALISDSYIGPHTAIEARVRVEGAELERSIVLADASVLHVGSRLVTSIVGRHARIFRDFSMPRALRLQVGEGDEVALC